VFWTSLHGAGRAKTDGGTWNNSRWTVSHHQTRRSRPSSSEFDGTARVFEEGESSSEDVRHQTNISNNHNSNGPTGLVMMLQHRLYHSVKSCSVNLLHDTCMSAWGNPTTASMNCCHCQAYTLSVLIAYIVLGHDFVLPVCSTNLHKQSFVVRCHSYCCFFYSFVFFEFSVLYVRRLSHSSIKCCVSWGHGPRPLGKRAFSVCSPSSWNQIQELSFHIVS